MSCRFQEMQLPFSILSYSPRVFANSTAFSPRLSEKTQNRVERYHILAQQQLDITGKLAAFLQNPQLISHELEPWDEVKNIPTIAELLLLLRHTWFVLGQVRYKPRQADTVTQINEFTLIHNALKLTCTKLKEVADNLAGSYPSKSGRRPFDAILAQWDMAFTVEDRIPSEGVFEIGIQCVLNTLLSTTSLGKPLPSHI